MPHVTNLLPPVTPTKWSNKGCDVCYHVCVIKHVKDPYLSVVRVSHWFPIAGFFLSLYSLIVLNMNIDIIQIQKFKNHLFQRCLQTLLVVYVCELQILLDVVKMNAAPPHDICIL